MNDQNPYVEISSATDRVRAHMAQREARRLQKDRTYLQMAQSVSGLGTCCRLKVGCVLLSREGRVVGTGYNGAGPGMAHCHPDTCNDHNRCVRTAHAEKNALFNRSADPHTAYVTAEPCLDCAKDLILAGVRRVVYLKPYRSISDHERTARQEWIDHYQVEWEQGTTTGHLGQAGGPGTQGMIPVGGGSNGAFVAGGLPLDWVPEPLSGPDKA
jgi:dCMP deaminase